MVEFQSGKNVVSFNSYGDKVAAHFYLPENFDPNQKYPAIVLAPPATGVKEQTIGVYASRLVQDGFVALAFDPRGWGESEGIPGILTADRVSEDAKNAICYMHALSFVDKENTFAFGTCMGSAFAALTACMDARVKGLAVVSPYVDVNDMLLAGVGGSSVALRKSFLSMASQARQVYYETGEISMMKVVPETEEEIKEAPTEIVAGMVDYYLPGKPGSVPTWRNSQNMMSLDAFATWSIFPYTHLFEAIPTVVVYGDKAASADGAERFYQEINGPKEKLVFEGADHFDLYWKPEYVEPAAKKISAFLKAQM